MTGAQVAARRGSWLSRLPIRRENHAYAAIFLAPTVLLVLALIVYPLGYSLLLNQEFPGRMLVRASLLIPWALPPVVVAAMFQWFLDGRRGLLPPWLVQLGLVETPPSFFSGVPGTLFT